MIDKTIPSNGGSAIVGGSTIGGGGSAIGGGTCPICDKPVYVAGWPNLPFDICKGHPVPVPTDYVPIPKDFDRIEAKIDSLCRERTVRDEVARMKELVAQLKLNINALRRELKEQKHDLEEMGVENSRLAAAAVELPPYKHNLLAHIKSLEGWKQAINDAMNTAITSQPPMTFGVGMDGLNDYLAALIAWGNTANAKAAILNTRIEKCIQYNEETNVGNDLIEILKGNV